MKYFGKNLLISHLTFADGFIQNNHYYSSNRALRAWCLLETASSQFIFTKKKKKKGHDPHFIGICVKAQRVQDLPIVTEMKIKWSGWDVNPGVSEHKAYVLPTSTWAGMQTVEVYVFLCSLQYEVLPPLLLLLAIILKTLWQLIKNLSPFKC